MIENIRLSFQGIWSHKMRSFLTMLGIIIGIASIIAIVSTIKGTNEQIKENLIGAGGNTVNVQLYQGDWAYDMSMGTLPSGVPLIDQDKLKEIKDIDGVASVSAYTMRQEYETVYYLNTNISSAEVRGVDDNYLSTCGYKLKEGRDFVESDFSKSKKVVIIDENAAKTLFSNERAIGKTIEVKGEPFFVIGVYVESEEFEPVINSMEDYETYMSSDTAGQVIIPDSTWPIIYQFDEPQNVVVKAETTDDMSKVGKKTADVINEDLSTESDDIKYQAENLLEQAKQLQELSNSTNKQLIWIASISLLVGGIGVMNIMLVSVTERTREIGLKKAIGARKTKILGQFLTEAAVLTSMGGLLGVVAGIALAEGISRISSTPVAISIPAAFGSVLFSMLIGVVFGLLPSYKAANLNPIEALRYE